MIVPKNNRTERRGVPSCCFFILISDGPATYMLVVSTFFRRAKRGRPFSLGALVSS